MKKIQEAHKNKRKHANAQFVSISCQKINNITIHLLINYPSFLPHLPRLKDKSWIPSWQNHHLHDFKQGILGVLLVLKIRHTIHAVFILTCGLWLSILTTWPCIKFDKNHKNDYN